MQGDFGRLVGRSTAMQRVYGEIAQVAQSDSPLLICGESGSGKESVAREIWSRNAKNKRDLAVIRGDGVPETDLEGLILGTLTAPEGSSRHPDVACRPSRPIGCVLLKYAEDWPRGAQGRLRELLMASRSASSNGRPRILVASLRTLATLERSGEVDPDLVEELARACIEIPPLRMRDDDALLLAEHFIRVWGKGRPYRLPPESRDAIRAYPFPGNVRELECYVQRAIVLSGERLDLERSLFPGRSGSPER